jgi:hypothetical protein
VVQEESGLQGRIELGPERVEVRAAARRDRVAAQEGRVGRDARSAGLPALKVEEHIRGVARPALEEGLAPRPPRLARVPSAVRHIAAVRRAAACVRRRVAVARSGVVHVDAGETRRSPRTAWGEKLRCCAQRHRVPVAGRRCRGMLLLLLLGGGLLGAQQRLQRK